MSQENVDTIRQMIERANSAGWDAELLVSNWVHPEARVYPAADFPGPDLYVGREEKLLANAFSHVNSHAVDPESARVPDGQKPSVDSAPPTRHGGDCHGGCW